VPNIRGVEIAITDTGAGLPFFWGHGLSGSMEQDEQNALLDWARLARRCRLVRWDARGHGRSGGEPEPDDYRWDNLGRDLVALADALGVERFVAGGASMGAATALQAAIEAPDRVVGLVLVLAPTAYETRAGQAGLYRAGADLVERSGMAAYIEQASTQPVPAILSKFADLYHPVPRVPEHLFPAVLRGAASSDLPPPDVVRAVPAPTLLLPWDTDPGHPVSTSERLAELLPDAELHVALRLRDVATWTDRIEAFLERVAGSSRQDSSVTPKRST
jgi:pimeloyl-ACP methyl ester carboxylesterase